MVTHLDASRRYQLDGRSITRVMTPDPSSVPPAGLEKVLLTEGPLSLVQVGLAYRIDNSDLGETVWRTDSFLGARGKFGTLQKQLRRAERVRVRPCMKCEQPMESEGAHHRMCGRCRHLRPGLI